MENWQKISDPGAAAPGTVKQIIAGGDSLYGVFANAKSQGTLNPYKYNSASNKWEMLTSTGGRAYAANNVTLYMILNSIKPVA